MKIAIKGYFIHTSRLDVDVTESGYKSKSNKRQRIVSIQEVFNLPYTIDLSVCVNYFGMLLQLFPESRGHCYERMIKKSRCITATALS